MGKNKGVNVMEKHHKWVKWPPVEFEWRRIKQRHSIVAKEGKVASNGSERKRIKQKQNVVAKVGKMSSNGL